MTKSDAPPTNALATPAWGANKPIIKSPAGGKTETGATDYRSTAGPRVQPDSPRPAAKRPAPTPATNPQTMRSGAPHQTGQGEKQLDGTRTATMSQPVKKPGLAERQPAPTYPKGSGERRSGLEDAMAAEADRLHPRKLRPR